jgi:hypothetical protein
MLVRLILSASCGLALAACATTAPEPAPHSSHQEAEALADLLLETGRSNPARIDSARAEMAALTDALRNTPLAQPVEPAPSNGDAGAPGPAPNLEGARSVMSAVHLASYRRLDHAEAGWRELQEAHPARLAGLHARFVEADLGSRGVFLRLKAGPLDSPAEARALCAQFEADGLWCAPADFTGQHLP